MIQEINTVFPNSAPVGGGSSGAMHHSILKKVTLNHLIFFTPYIEVLKFLCTRWRAEKFAPLDLNSRRGRC